MSRFIEECRREWKRLRVPDAIVNEMAADLAADLAEAEAEGASAEDVLGNAVFDPRAFALSWAEERGVVSAAPVRSDSSVRLSTALAVAAAVLLLVALVGAALVVVDRPGAFGVRLAASGPRFFWRAPRAAFVRPGIGQVRVSPPLPPPAPLQGVVVASRSPTQHRPASRCSSSASSAAPSSRLWRGCFAGGLRCSEKTEGPGDGAFGRVAAERGAQLQPVFVPQSRHV